MRIISNFKDYYDGFGEHTKDWSTHVWVRKQQEILINKNRLTLLEERHIDYWSSNLLTFYLIIAGTVVPILHYSGYEKGYFGTEFNKYYFNLESFKKDYPDVYKEEFERFPYPGKTNRLEKFFLPYPDMLDLCLEFKTPVLLINPCFYRYETKDSSLRTCFANPELKQFNISKLYTAPQLYQKLDYFVSNLLVEDPTPHGVQTNTEKIEAHGFDKVISFRKEKKK